MVLLVLRMLAMMWLLSPMLLRVQHTVLLLHRLPRRQRPLRCQQRRVRLRRPEAGRQPGRGRLLLQLLRQQRQLRLLHDAQADPAFGSCPGW